MPAAPVPAPPVPAPPAFAGPTEAELRARELIVPVADRSAFEPAISPVQPGTPQPARPTVRGPEVRDFEGGAPCPWCSTPNPVDRHFCRRCAMSLAARTGVTRPMWWRRMWNWLRHRRETPYAGQRPRLRNGVGRPVRWAVTLAVVAVLGIEVDAHAGAAVTAVEDHFAKPVQVFATHWTASSSDPNHPLTKLYDSFNNTWWGPGAQGAGTGAYMNAEFDQPIALLDVIVNPGAGVEEDTFTSEWRPQSLDVTLTRADGSSTQTTITLNDNPGPQTFAVHGQDLTQIRLTVKSAYTADVSGFSELAVSDIEFFVRSSSGS
jgi:hypothetical protein